MELENPVIGTSVPAPANLAILANNPRAVRTAAAAIRAIDAALLEALKANRGFKVTKGSTLSVDPETMRFELTRYDVLDDLSPDKLVAIVEDFATALVDLRERLGGEHLSGSPEEVAESLGMEGFIRV